MFIWPILIGVVIYLIFRNSKDPQQSVFNKFTDSSDQSLKILNERYARGEIQEEEYLHKKSELIKK